LLLFLEFELEKPCAKKVNRIDDELVFSAWFINGDSAVTDDLLPISDILRQIFFLTLEKDCLDLCSTVFQDEVEMARERKLQVGYLSADMDKSVLALDEISYGMCEFGYGLYMKLHERWQIS
jgi:hypothetical protein